MGTRLLGIETEYAFALLDRRGAAEDTDFAVLRLIETARGLFPHLPDAHSPGLFTANAARLYADAGAHPEFSTPECDNPWDVVRYVAAGHRMLAAAAAALVPKRRGAPEAVLLRANVDYAGTRQTWGSHESYLHRAGPGALPAQLVPHLASRLVYSGAGGFNSQLHRGIHFTLSPRVWHLRSEVSDHSTQSRGIFHTKDEPLARGGYHRLHLLCGESLCSETALWLRVATTALIVALVEAGGRPGDAVQLRAPLQAMRRFASDPTCRATARGATGQALGALAIQRHYLDQVAAQADAPFMPEWAAEACVRWRDILDRLARGPAAVATTLDWSIKLALFSERAARRGIAWEALPHWNHVTGELIDALDAAGLRAASVPVDTILAPRGPVAADVRRLTPYLREHGLTWDGLAAFVELRQELFELDVRFGQLGGKGIFDALDRAGALSHHVPGVDDIEHAMHHPPARGRARLRGEHVRQLAGAGRRYTCSWQALWDHEGRRRLDLSDPFGTAAEWEPWGPEQGPEQQGLPF